MSDEPYIIVGPHTARRMRAVRRRWPYLVGAGALLAAAVTAAILLWPRGSGALVAVKRGDIVHSLVAQGRVESETTIDLVPRVTARIAEVHVQEGDSVKRDQLLVTLDDPTARAQREEAARSVDAAQARRDEVERGARPEDLDRAAAQVMEAEQDWKRADAKRAELERGARPEEKEEAEATLLKAKAEANYAASMWESIRGLGLGTVSDRQRDEAKRNHEVAQALLRQAQAHRDRVVHGATEEEITQARALAEGAKARSDQARATLERLRNGATEEERRVAEAELKRAKAVLDRIDADLAQLKLTSPLDGIVVRRYRWPGEMAFPQMPKPILVLAESRGRKIRIEVAESDVFKIREGQSAFITSDGYPGRRWTGTVTQRASVMGKKHLLTENPKEKVDVKVLEAWITPDEPLDLPLNLPVEAKIAETLRQNVLILPARAVDSSGSVRLKDGQTRTVQIGVRDDAFVEILSGLSEGEKVRVAE